MLLTLLPSISKMISFCFNPPIIAGLSFWTSLITAGVKSFHAVDDSSADYILNKRKSLIGKLKVDVDNIKGFKSSIERYIINSIPVTDGWIAYEDLVNEPQKLIETVGLDTSHKPIDLKTLTTRKIKQPVNNITEYYEDPNKFDRVWNEVWTNTKK